MDDGNFHVPAGNVERNAQRPSCRAAGGWAVGFPGTVGFSRANPLARRLSPWTLARSATGFAVSTSARRPSNRWRFAGTIRRGSPFDQANWVESIARRLT